MSNRLTAADAVDELCGLYTNDLYRYAWLSLNDASAALDVVEDVFLRAFYGWDKFHNEADSKPWLFRLARNCITDRVHRQNTPISGIEPEAHEWIDFTPDPLAELERLLIRLKPDSRQALILHDGLQFTVGETASILGWSHMRVRLVWHRTARQLLAWQESARPELPRSAGESLRHAGSTLKEHLEMLQAVELSDQKLNALRGRIARAIANGDRPVLLHADRRWKYRRNTRFAALCALLLFAFLLVDPTGWFRSRPAIVGPKPDMSKAETVAWDGFPKDLQAISFAIGKMYGNPDEQPQIKQTTAKGDPSELLYIVSLPGSYQYHAPNGKYFHSSTLAYTMSQDGSHIWNLRAVDNANVPVLWSGSQVTVSISHRTFSGVSPHWYGSMMACTVTTSAHEDNNILLGTGGYTVGELRYVGNPAKAHGPFEYEMEMGGVGFGMMGDFPPDGVVSLNTGENLGFDANSTVDITVKWNGQEESLSLRLEDNSK